jgi:FkbM family methyltransferase
MEQQKIWYQEHIRLADQFIGDIGANVGTLSEFFWREAGAAGSVLSVEPLIEHCAVLRQRIAELGAANWRVEPVAVSHSKGSVALGVAMDHGRLNACVVRGGGSRMVRAARLHRLAPRATVVKLDIEGHEYEVLDDSLARMPHTCAWAIELHYRPDRPLQKVLALLLGEGFRVLAATQGQSIDAPWGTYEVLPTLGWDDVPAGVRKDGRPYKMLHIIAQRF